MFSVPIQTLTDIKPMPVTGIEARVFINSLDEYLLIQGIVASNEFVITLKPEQAHIQADEHALFLAIEELRRDIEASEEEESVSPDFSVCQKAPNALHIRYDGTVHIKKGETEIRFDVMPNVARQLLTAFVCVYLETYLKHEDYLMSANK